MESIVALALVCSLFSGVGLAQDAGADNMSILMEKIKADKKLLVAENMGLTDEESKNFWPLYDAYQKELEAIQMKYGKIIERYADQYQSMTDTEAKGFLDDYLKTEEEHLKTRQSSLVKFRGVLPEIKVVRYYQIENKIRAAVNYELASLIPLMK